MKNTHPLWALLAITSMVCVLMGVLPIIALIEGQDLQSEFSGFAAFAFLGMSMMVIYSTIRSIDRRLANIERQLKQSGQ